MIHYQNQEDYICATTYYETDSFFGFFFLDISTHCDVNG
jgi:hypothetical protein